MMRSNEQKYVSVRFKNSNNNNEKRMSIEEWEQFSQKSNYFRSSDDFLVEAAVEFKNSLPVEGIINDYNFSEIEFKKQCKLLPCLTVFSDALKSGVLNQSIYIKNKFGFLKINESAVLLSYYPPYIIALDTTYQTRVTIDISTGPNIWIEKNRIIVDYEV